MTLKGWSHRTLNLGNAIILPDEILQIVEPTQQGAGDWINCDTLAGRWKCSPFDVVQAIIKKGLKPKGSRRKH